MRRTRPLARAIALVVGVGLLVGACAAPAAPAPSASEQPRGGALVFALWQEPESLYPFYATQTVSGLVSDVAVEALIRVDPDGNYLPQLAREVPTLQNGGVKLEGGRMLVTYRLTPDVRWSDGTPFTSADVKFTWQAIMRDPKVVSREGYDKIDEIETPDPVTAVVRYREVYAPYATRFDAIVPKHILENVADVGKSDFVRLPIGTGPFKITEFVAADHITAERNPNYRIKDRPLLDKIIFKSVPSREVAVAQLKAGEVDGMWLLLEAQVPELEKLPEIKILSVLAARLERLEFNLAKPGNPADPSVPHPVLGDLAMRRALLLATPKQQVIDKLLFGKAKPGNSVIALGWAAPKDVVQESYDPQKARQVLDAAGWTPGADGIRSKGAVRASLRISTTTGDRIREQVEQILIDEWRQIGVELTIRNLPSSVLLGTWSGGSPKARGDFDIAMFASTPGLDPHAHLSLGYQCRNIPQESNRGAGSNHSRFCDPQFDRLVDEAGASVDQETRKQLYARAQRIVNENVVKIWVYNNSRIDAFRANVGGYRGNPWTSAVTWSAEDWFVRR